MWLKCTLLLYTIQLAKGEDIFQSDEARLAKKLLTNYNKEMLPFAGIKGKITKLRLGMTLSQIISVKEKDESLTISVYLTHEWEDPRLTWNKSEYGGIHIYRMPPEYIWMPRVILQNSKDGEFDVSLHVNTLIGNDGRIEWLPPALYKSSCSIEVALFPFDWQNCSMTFQLAAYDKSDIELELAYGNEIFVDCNAFQPNGEWDLLQKPVLVHTKKRNGQEYQSVIFNFIIQRRPQFYIMNLIIPCVSMTLISCFVFFLPSVSCEKMTLSISVLLGETVFLFLIAQRMPATSLSVPLIAGYLLFTMTLVICSVVFSVIVCNIHYRSSITHNMPAWVRVFFMDYLARYLKVERPSAEIESISKNQPRRRSSFRTKFEHQGYKQAPSEMLFDNQANRYGFRARHIQNQAGFIDVTVSPDGEIDVDSIPNAVDMIPEHLQSMIENIKYIANSIKQNQTEEQSCDDWAYVALILDRLLFWIYLTAFTFGSLGFFLQTTTADYPKPTSSSTC